MKCPIHTDSELVRSRTKYGLRWSCPVAQCTVVKWGGSTSTPADYQTRQKRIAAHAALDRIWQSGLMTRKAAYKALGTFMAMPSPQVHIGMFNSEQCEKVIAFTHHLMKGGL